MPAAPGDSPLPQSHRAPQGPGRRNPGQKWPKGEIKSGRTRGKPARGALCPWNSPGMMLRALALPVPRSPLSCPHPTSRSSFLLIILLFREWKNGKARGVPKNPGKPREWEGRERGGGCILGESRSVSPRLWEQHPVGFYSLHPAAWPFPASHTRALRFSSPCSENEGKRASARAGNSVLAPQGCESSPRVVGNAGTPALELHFGVLGGNQAGK